MMSDQTDSENEGDIKFGRNTNTSLLTRQTCENNNT